MDKRIEILAPAGSYEAMKAAFNGGADAVYIGGSRFGARAYANNLDEETLLRAIDEAHLRNKKLYLTVNTLVKEQELFEGMYEFLRSFYLQGLDAIIVQDIGVMSFVHENFNKLPIHASTQTTIMMAEGAELLKQLGVTRIVTARELSLQETRMLYDNSKLEIEAFVHGALCYCYSGQCLMSSMLGGRSGNRGRCAQPCRMMYDFYHDRSTAYRNMSQESASNDKNQLDISSMGKNGAYLLSPKDINTLSMIPELIEAGIVSFKIEGRMKSPQYTALVSHLYREYTDYYLDYGKEKYIALLNSTKYHKDMSNLMDIYNRGGFSKGYGGMYHGKAMMSLNRPNHCGVLVGKVRSVKGGQAEISLVADVNAQDVLEIRNHNAEKIYEFTVKDAHNNRMLLKTNLGAKKNEVRVGEEIFRTKNNYLLEQLDKDYIKQDRKIEVNGLLTARVGEKLRLQVLWGDMDITAYHEEVQAATKQPMTADRLTAAIKKTGDTLFVFKELMVDTDDNVFVPVAWLNEIRREAISLLQEAITSKFRRSLDLSDKQQDILEEPLKAARPFGISIRIQSREQFEAGLAFTEVSSIYAEYDTLIIDDIIQMGEAAVKTGKRFYLSLPHICRAMVYSKLESDIKELINKDILKGFIVKNLEEITLLMNLLCDDICRYELILNYNMYIFNSEAKSFYKKLNITHYTASVELNNKELLSLGITDSDLIVYGHQPLMVSVQCLYENTVGCNRCKAGELRKEYITDRMGKRFYIQTLCNGCYNIILNGQCLSLLKYSQDVTKLNPINLRLDFTIESRGEVKSVLTSFIDTFCKGKTNNIDGGEYTTGHFKRGVE